MESPTNADAIESALARPSYLPIGTTAAFLEQSRDTSTAIAILFITGLVFVLIAARLYARQCIVREVGLDDALVLSSLVPFAAFVALCIVLIHLGSGRHFLYVQYILSNEQQNLTEVLDFSAHIIYTTTLLLCRLSGLAFFWRISSRVANMVRPIRGAAVFLVTAYLPQLFLIMFHCLPVTGHWPYSFQPEVDRYTCLQWGTVYVTNSTISLVSDLVLLAIPAVMITSLRVSNSRKVKLSLILMPGLIVIAISSIRLYLVVVGQWESDESWSYDALLAIEVAEIGSTIIALSVPALKPFFSNLFEFIDGPLSSKKSRKRTKNSSQEGWHPHHEDAVSLRRKPKSRQSRPPSDLAVCEDFISVDESVRSMQLTSKRELDREWEGESLHTAQIAYESLGREPSIQTDTSRKPMIYRKVEFSVASS